MNDSPDLYAFIHDAKWFALYNRSVIEKTPLQLYCSALIFAPESSVVRRKFKDCIPEWIQLKPKVQTHWNAAQQTLEGHTSYISSVAFSPDGKQLPILQVSNHWVVEDDTIILWLPPDYREICSATWNRSLVIGHASGRVSLFCFKQEQSLSYRIRTK